jgi:alpha-mannosidase
VLDTIKRGEDDADISSNSDISPPSKIRKGKSVIVRVYDSLGCLSHGVLEIGEEWDVKKVWKCNLLEDDEEEVGFERGSGRVEIVLKAFEIATYRLQL